MLQRSNLQTKSEMPCVCVVDLLRLFQQNNIEVWVDGGWGVDALLHRQTRAHEDLDIALHHEDVRLLRNLLEARGYQDIPRDDTRDCNFVMGDSAGHQIDIHTFAFDDSGNNIYGCEYPLDSLTGQGLIDEFPVKCISPGWAVKFHLGYKPDADDYADVTAICQRFEIEVPAEYRELSFQSE